MTQRPLEGQGHLIVEVLQSYSDTPHMVGLLWTSDRPVTETSDITQHSKLHGPGEVRTRNPNKRVAADPLLKPRYRCFINLPIGSIVKQHTHAVLSCGILFENIKY